jgi:hypothetical protein
MASEPDSNGSIVDLSKIMAWYASHCDGDWEHQQGVSIQTLDNPGWLLKVNLIGTNLENATMLPISEDCDERSNPEADAWIDCRIREHEFVGASDPTQLPRLINIFSSLIDSHPR